MSRITEKYCGFYRNDTLLKRHNSFCLNKNLVALNAIRITIDAFLLLASIVFGVLKKLYQDLTNLIRIQCFFCLKNFIFKKWVFVLLF
ncbi:hypothetical protein BB472_00415 [Helicobacter pylori]|nr:hypothetical protein BB472_00415 [Helicobacter pylori]